MTDLYDDQIKAAKDFEDLLNNTSTTVVGLWSSAGYGKSYATRHIIVTAVLANSNYIPVLTSMTHSSAEVLSQFTGMEVTTLHSLMGWVPCVDRDTGEEYLSTPRMRDKNVEDRLTAEHLVVVDEAGLMGHEEVRLLKIECERTGARLLLVGDNKQCFPVIKDEEELCVPAYEATEAFLVLDTPKRVDKYDTIYQLSLVARESVDGGRFPRFKTILNKDGKTGVRHVDDLEEFAIPAFKAGLRDDNIRDIKILTFRNIRALKFNRKIRKKVLGISDPFPTVGEEMIANTSIEAMDEDNAVLIYNNQKLIVQSVEKTSSFGLDGAFIQYKDLHDEPIGEVVFVAESPEKYQARLKELSSRARWLRDEGKDDEARQAWQAFFSLKDGVADIRFTYAVTVNKAQGTTLHHALVDMDDINRCRHREQKARLAYTAISRASKFLTIEGSLSED